MLEQKGTYDPIIVSALKDIQMGKNEMTINLVNVSELQTGMILAEDVRTEKGVLLVSKGQDVSMPVLKRIRSFSEGVGVAEPFRVFVPHMATQQNSHQDKETDEKLSMLQDMSTQIY